MKINVYLLKEYRDDYAYGEESIAVFDTKEKAVEQLKKDVQDWAGAAWTYIPSKLDMTDDDVFEEDYVSYMAPGEYTVFFIVEEHEMELFFDTEAEIFRRMNWKYDMADAHNLNNDEFDPSNKLSEDELEEAVERYEDRQDWNSSYADQLRACMNEVKNERKPCQLPTA